MALVTFTLTWRAAPSADVNTDYEVYTDLATPGQFVLLNSQDAALNPAGAVYTPASATPVDAVGEDDTTITLPSGSVTSIPANSLIQWDREVILLGSVASGANDVYSGCLRGVLPTFRAAHTTASDVYGVHEEYSGGTVNIGTRKAIRTRAYRVQGADRSRAREGVKVFPSERIDAAHTVIWGLVQDETGIPQAGVTVTMTPSADCYISESGEHILPIPRKKTTDTDGYFEFDAVITAAVTGTYALTMTIGPSSLGGGAITKQLISIPDRDYVNFEECI